MCGWLFSFFVAAARVVVVATAAAAGVGVFIGFTQRILLNDTVLK